MIVCKTLAEWREYRQSIAASSLGFVPTMGSLHAGHLQLVQQARGENTHTAVSIFVNPTQFNDSVDFALYPRDFTADLAKLSGFADCVFCPDTPMLYPAGSSTIVEVEALSDILLGETRPQHFRGVATVVAKLLNIVQADRAYFGLKDYQQVQIIRALVRDLFIDTQIVALPTVRERDGLAMSSRNARLTPEQRAAALVLSQALKLAETLDWGDMEASIARVGEYIAEEPLARVASVEMRDAETMAEVSTQSRAGVLLLAVYFDDILLIDQAVYALGVENG